MEKGKNKHVAVALEFWEDKNGTLFVQEYNSITQLSDKILWTEYIEKSETMQIMLNMWRLVNANYEHLINTEKWGSNLTMSDIMKVLRKFISRWLASRDYTTYDYEEYTDGTNAINLDEMTCSQRCPIIRDIQNYIIEKKYEGTESNYHATEHFLKSYKKGIENENE